MTGKGPNRLISEKSPYLLQHADNPVDWYPWGEEAFGEAKRENRPVFLLDTRPVIGVMKWGTNHLRTPK